MRRFLSLKFLLVYGLAGLFIFYSGYRFYAYRHPAPEAPTVHLNRYYHFTQLMRTNSLRVAFTHYRSKFDDSVQSVWVMEPEGEKTERLFFFFHGMDGDAGDGVVVRDLAEQCNARVVSLGGRGPSWISDAFLSDAEQVLRHHGANFPKFYLVGISMGATQALILAGLLPQDLRRSLAGVLAIMPGADLSRIAHQSSLEGVRNTLQNSAGGEEEKLKQRSPLALISQYAPALPMAIFFQDEDKVLDVVSLRHFIRQARIAGHPISAFYTSGNHRFLYARFPYRTLFESLGKNMDAPLRDIQ